MNIEPLPTSFNPLRPFLAGMAVSALVLSALVFLAMRGGVLTKFDFFTSQEEQQIVIPSGDVVVARQNLLELSKFLLKIKEKIETGTDKNFTPTPDRFYPINSIFPEEYNKLPVGVRALSQLFLRVSGSDYKILVDGKLCTVANHDKILNLDPVREKNTLTLCRYLSIWKGEGELF